MLVSLRRRFPEARIDWLVRDVFADAIRAHPDLSHALPFPRDLWRRRTPRNAARMAQWLRELRTPRYELVIDCQGLARSGLFALATRAKRRIGDAAASEFAWLAYNVRVQTGGDAHVVDRALALAQAADASPIRDMRLYAPRAEGEAGAITIPDEPYALLAPTSAWPGKCWAAERFAELGRRLLEHGEVERIVLVGAASERGQIQALLDAVSDDPRFLDCVGATSIAELMRLIERASLVVANDSAAMHMAVGFDRPLVALLGPTSAALAGPYGRMESVVQVVTDADTLSHRACKDAAYGSSLMNRITVEHALSKALEQLESARAHASTAATVRT